jgi:hypothetical protein
MEFHASSKATLGISVALPKYLLEAKGNNQMGETG